MNIVMTYPVVATRISVAHTVRRAISDSEWILTK